MSAPGERECKNRDEKERKKVCERGQKLFPFYIEIFPLLLLVLFFDRCLAFILLLCIIYEVYCFIVSTGLVKVYVDVLMMILVLIIADYCYFCDCGYCYSLYWLCVN